VNERQLDKNAAKRLAIIRHAREVTGNVALTCRYYGISRRSSTSGIAATRPRAWPGCATRPRGALPARDPAEVVEKIIYLRQNYHFGPASAVAT
jgi:hypothetical protein